MKITYYGHSSFELEINGKHLLVDPFISPNPKSASIDINTLKADYILLTHAHYDHIMDVDALVERTKAKIISNHEVVTYFNTNKGYEGHAMNQGGSWDFDFGRVKVVSAIHSSSFPDGTYGGNPVGFIISAEGKSIYISGDTALTMDMKLIPLFFKLDAALLPIGGNFTMDIDEAVVAADFIECDKIIGMHYDTAPYIEINHDAAKAKFSSKGKELVLLEIGDSINV
ncbi:MAG: metal-dependent hydrolase [Crocinitomicaceae bacterium]|nr:metal-dependent hydrolase [Crocinitomicaceae bacterium]